MGFHPPWPEIANWISRSEQILIKKLARNDCSWADDSSKHQAGFYVPAAIQQTNFLPQLKNTNPEKPYILDALYFTFWPASGEIRESALHHYSNKGSEYHHTRIPKDQFANLSPASLLVGGKLIRPVEAASHWYIAVDSTSPEAETIESVFSLESDFHFGLFSPDTLRAALSQQDQLIQELREALRTGRLEQFIGAQMLPDPAVLASRAQDLWLIETGADSFDPFRMNAPGDAVMRISRDIEFDLYRRAELRQRASQVAGLLLAGDDPVSALVRRFGDMDQIFLSASQTRKSRAGLSFEHHVRRLLVDGRIFHEPQVVFGGRRPDFVLPNVAALKGRARAEAVILSLKTTLRERWKQLGMERKFGAVFLATVDDRVPTPAIAEMASQGIVLVVPESLKKSDEAVYDKNDQVITFKDFFEEQIARRRPALLVV